MQNFCQRRKEIMKTKLVLKLAIMACLISGTAYLLRGNDRLTDIVFFALVSVAVLMVCAKLVFYWKWRRGMRPPGGGGSGRRGPPDALVPRTPTGRPPVLFAAAEIPKD
jgi:hypothetical protein